MTALPYDGALVADRPPTISPPPRHTFHEEITMTSKPADHGTDRGTDRSAPAHPPTGSTAAHETPDLHEAFPGFGSVPYSTPANVQASGVAVSEEKPRKGSSMILLVSGLGAIAIAAWVLLDTPAITPTIGAAAGVTIAILFGLYLLTRK